MINAVFEEEYYCICHDERELRHIRMESNANVNHFFTLLGKMFFTPYGKEFFTYLGKQIFTS